MFIVNLLRLHIGGIVLWKLPSLDTLPKWFLRELYTDGVKDWGSLNKNLATARFWYRMNSLVWMLTVAMALPLPTALLLVELDVSLPQLVIDSILMAFVVAVPSAFAYLIFVLPDRQLSILSRLDRELRELGGVFAEGLHSLNHESMTQEKFEEALDTEMTKLSSLVSQRIDEGRKYEAMRLARRLNRLIQLSKELDFMDHHTDRYHELKTKAEAAMAAM